MITKNDKKIMLRMFFKVSKCDHFLLSFFLEPYFLLSFMLSLDVIIFVIISPLFIIPGNVTHSQILSNSLNKHT